MYLTTFWVFASSSLSFQLDSYEVQLNFHVVSFASETKAIVNISDTEISGDADEVIWALMEFEYNSRTSLVFFLIKLEITYQSNIAC